MTSTVGAILTAKLDSTAPTEKAAASIKASPLKEEPGCQHRQPGARPSVPFKRRGQIPCGPVSTIPGRADLGKGSRSGISGDLIWVRAGSSLNAAGDDAMPTARSRYERENRAFAGLALGGVLLVAAVVIAIVWSWLVGVLIAALGV